MFPLARRGGPKTWIKRVKRYTQRFDVAFRPLPGASVTQSKERGRWPCSSMGYCSTGIYGAIN